MTEASQQFFFVITPSVEKKSVLYALAAGVFSALSHMVQVTAAVVVGGKTEEISAVQCRRRKLSSGR